MDFDAEEIVQLRKNILDFVLQQLREAADRGELKQAAAQLSGPIGAAVEAAITRALAARQSPANAKLGEAEISRIATAVARQLDGRSMPVPTVAETDGDAPFHGTDILPPSTTQSPADSPHGWQRIGVPLLALIAGLALGLAGARLLSPAEPAPSGTDSATITEETRPVASSDAQLRELKAPQGSAPTVPTAAPTPASGGAVPRQ